MISTHMGYGFVISYLLLFILNHLGMLSPSLIASISILVISGAVGGIFPDIDRKEDWGLKHRQTLHYAIGYGALSALLFAIGLTNQSTPLFVASCFFAGAWLHSFMDIFGGWWGTPHQSVYEHIRRKWFYAYNFVPFATDREWSLQSFSDVTALAISPSLPPLMSYPGWVVGLTCFFIIWLVSTFYELLSTAPKRRAMVREYEELQAKNA